jgi:hypothetical protein
VWAYLVVLLADEGRDLVTWRRAAVTAARTSRSKGERERERERTLTLAAQSSPRHQKQTRPSTRQTKGLGSGSFFKGLLVREIILEK